MKDGDFLGRVYSDGEVIFKEGDKGEGMYVVQSGKVRISMQTSSGEVVLNTIGSGDILGEMAIFDKQPRSATASALGEARILSVDKAKLFRLISGDPTTAFKIIESMSTRIRRLSDELSKYKNAQST
ncbi:MAG: Crp/Fnr family transcriptional regulator [Nitrospirae bacterium]|nr:Crp/Fnr family transcriptional regulator [Nitrospirota bacterium]